MMPASVFLADMNREQVREFAPGATVVLPTASTEQHGPHLPICTDTVECTAICQQAAELARTLVPVAVTPTLTFGYSHNHIPQPGMMSLTPATFLQVMRELGDCLYRSGFRRLVIINSHGWNDELIRVATYELSIAYHMTIAASSYWTVAWQSLVREADATQLGRIPSHAGAFETALMLVLRPELVDRSPLPPAGDKEHIGLEQTQRPLIRIAGRRRGVGPGYTDDPSAATAEAGRKYLSIIARDVAAFIVDVHRQHSASEPHSDKSERVMPES